MRYQVNMTAYAIEQLKEAAVYIAQTLQAPDAARKWLEKLEREIAGLNQMPLRFPLTEEEPWHSHGIRKMPVGNFLVYYWTDCPRNAVWVTAVVYGRRDQLAALRAIPPE